MVVLNNIFKAANTFLTMNHEDIASKTGLSDIADYDTYFEISTVKDEGFVLKEVRRKIMSHISLVTDMLSKYIFPDSSFFEAYDAQALSDEDREKTMKVLKDFRVLQKKNTLLNLSSNDGDERECCKEGLALYIQHLPHITELVEKVKNSYSTQIINKERLHYLG